MTLISTITADRLQPPSVAPIAVERGGAGVALLDGNGDLICTNQEGRRLLAEVVRASAPTSASKWLRQLTSQTLQNDATGADRHDYAATITLTSTRHIATRTIVLSHGDGHTDRAMIMLLFTDLGTSPQINPATLRRVFGLTAAEAEVAARIARGETLSKISKSKKVSLPTLRSQLAAVFGKTRTRRQTELALLLARMGDLP